MNQTTVAFTQIMGAYIFYQFFTSLHIAAQRGDYIVTIDYTGASYSTQLNRKLWTQVYTHLTLHLCSNVLIN